jgi:tetratricopeptide (TPR) repeat protein
MKKYFVLVLIIFVLVFSGCDKYNLLDKGNAKYDADDYEGAIKEYSQLISTNSDDSVLEIAYTNRGSALIKIGRVNEAISDLDMAEKISLKQNLGYADPTYPTILDLRCDALNLLNNSENAIKECDKAISLATEFNKNELYVYFADRCYAKMAVNDLTGAMSDCDKSIELNNTRAKVYSLRAKIKYIQKDYTSAQNDIDKSLQLDANFNQYINSETIKSAIDLETCNNNCTHNTLCCNAKCVLPKCVSDNDCNDNTSSTKDSCINPQLCNAQCDFKIISDCINGDNYCPPKCSVLNDDSCKYNFTGAYNETDLNKAIELGRNNRLNPEDTYANYYVNVQGYDALIMTPYLLVANDVAKIFHNYEDISYEKRLNWSYELDTNVLFISTPFTTIDDSWEAFRAGKTEQEIYQNVNAIDNVIIKDAGKVYESSRQTNSYFVFDCLNQIHNKTVDVVFIYPSGEYSISVNFNEYK